ncbi:MAG: putative DNA-binding transcriptional regulator AlpA [Colwellia sp.]|jgi:predicted DNA-binding transcriptional regulator AlpA
MKLLSTMQVCEMLGVTDRTLFNWRQDDETFPKPIFMGNTNKYKEHEIEAFVEQKFAA